MSYWCSMSHYSNLLTEYIVHNTFAAVVRLVEGQFSLPWKMLKFVILQHRILSNIIKKGRIILWSYESMNVKRLLIWCLCNIKHAPTEDKVHKCSCKEYNGKKQLKHTAADFCCMISLINSHSGCVASATKITMPLVW